MDPSQPAMVNNITRSRKITERVFTVYLLSHIRK